MDALVSKKAGALENSSRGVWSITKIGENLQQSEIKNLTKKVRASYPLKIPQLPKEQEIDVVEDTEEPTESWQDKLLNILQTIEPSDFEKYVNACYENQAS